jgi:hypothetical protein
MFTPVNYTSKIAFKLMELIYETPDDAWQPYYNFMALKVPANILDKEPLLVELAKKRKFHAGILRMEPNSCYNWHVDTDRHVSLNMLVFDDGNSKCVFANEYQLVMPITELKYKEFTYYIFNTKVPHIVFNFNEPRYLFSLEFLDEDRGLTYDELCTDIQGLNHGN